MNAALTIASPQVVDPEAVPPAANTPQFADLGDASGPVAQRLAHLFRASLKDGRIHPLYLPMLRYRHSPRAE